jgi:hypothetical protein
MGRALDAVRRMLLWVVGFVKKYFLVVTRDEVIPLREW